MPTDIDLATCRAEFEAASRKPHLAEVWFYEWGQRLLDACDNNDGTFRSASVNGYSFPDGSFVRTSTSANPGFWYATRKDGSRVRDDSGHLHFFQNAIDAARALAALGEGPGATP